MNNRLSFFSRWPTVQFITEQPVVYIMVFLGYNELLYEHEITNSCCWARERLKPPQERGSSVMCEDLDNSSDNKKTFSVAKPTTLLPTLKTPDKNSGVDTGGDIELFLVTLISLYFNKNTTPFSKMKKKVKSKNT